MSEDINTPNNGEELDNIIILNDENGNEVKFEFLDLRRRIYNIITNRRGRR